jgi:2-haloacid dehalogenase
MLADAVNSAGLAGLFDQVLSVEEIGRYKPLADVYEIATSRLGLKPNEIAFQSSNRWDVAGAAAFGMQCHWINRTGQPDEYPDLPPVKVLADLAGLL